MIIQRINKLNIDSALEVAKEFIDKNKGNDFYHESWLKLANYKAIFFNPCVFDAFGIMRSKDDKVMGYIIGRPYDKENYDIRGHYIKEEFRHRYLGTMLKAHLTRFVKEQNYLTINSLVSKDNEASIKLNESAGWTRTIADEKTYRYILRLR